MDNKIEMVADILLKSGNLIGFTSLVDVMLRVKIAASLNISSESDKIFDEMQKASASELGYFNISSELFASLYDLLKGEDILEYLSAVVQRLGNEKSFDVLQAPVAIQEWFSDKLNEDNWTSVFIPIAENYMCDLRPLANKHINKTITIGAINASITKLLGIAYKDYKNVNIITYNPYEKPNFDKKFDLIFCVPAFGGRRFSDGDDFICRELDLVAAENFLSMLTSEGRLQIVLPARVTFAAGRVGNFRGFVESNFGIKEIRELPCGIFCFTKVKTFYFEFLKKSTSNVLVSSYDFKDKKKPSSAQIECLSSKEIPINTLKEQGNWSVERQLDNKSLVLQSFYNSPVKKVKIKEIADVFRGKAVKAKNETGNILVINISNISSEGIDYGSLDSFEEEERKVKRYELQTGDVLLTCRGTAIKAAVFEQQEKMCIPAVSLVVIRPGNEISSEFIKVFFETELGKEVLKSCSVGGYSIQMTHTDVMEIPIPMFDRKKQLEIVEQYNKNKSEYQQLIEDAERKWNKAISDITQKMI